MTSHPAHKEIPASAEGFPIGRGEQFRFKLLCSRLLDPLDSTSVEVRPQKSKHLYLNIAHQIAHWI